MKKLAAPQHRCRTIVGLKGLNASRIAWAKLHCLGTIWLLCSGHVFNGRSTGAGNIVDIVLEYLRGRKGCFASWVAKSNILRLGESTSQPKYDINNCACVEVDVKHAKHVLLLRCFECPQLDNMSCKMHSSTVNNMSRKLHANTANKSCRYRTIVGLKGTTMHQGSPRRSSSASVPEYSTISIVLVLKSKHASKVRRIDLAFLRFRAANVTRTGASDIVQSLGRMGTMHRGITEVNLCCVGSGIRCASAAG